LTAPGRAVLTRPNQPSVSFSNATFSTPVFSPYFWPVILRSGSCLISSGSLYGSPPRFSVSFTPVLSSMRCSPPSRLRVGHTLSRARNPSGLGPELFEERFLPVLLSRNIAQGLVLDQQWLVISLPFLR